MTEAKNTRVKRKCYYPKCSNTDVNSSGKLFFRFPSKADEKEIWLRIIDNPTLKTSSYTRICADHFEDSSFNDPEKKTTLKSGSVPTLITKIEEQKIHPICLSNRPQVSDIIIKIILC